MHTRTHFAALVAAANAGRFHPRIAATYPLAEIHRAQHDFTTSKQPGKLVLIPAS